MTETSFNFIDGIFQSYLPINQ